MRLGGWTGSDLDLGTFAILLAVPIFVLLQPNRFSRSLRIAMLGLVVVVGAVLLAFTYQYALMLIGREKLFGARSDPILRRIVGP